MSAPTLEEVIACPALPSMPAVAIDVLELTRDKDVKLQTIADVVQNDPALTAKILRTVNSSYYGLAKPCPTITRALAYLGLSTVKSLVLGFSLVDITRKSANEFDLTSFWQRSLYSAAAARYLASKTGKCDPPEAFITALMSDIGMLAIHATASDAYGDAIARTEGDHQRLLQLESDLFGFDHTEAGEQLGIHWRLPPQIAQAIRHHHDLETGDNLDLDKLVSTACGTSVAVCTADPGPAVARVRRRMIKYFGLTTADVQSLVENLSDETSELSQLFKMPTGAPIDANRILAEAEEAAVEHQLAVRRETENLKRTNDKLARQARTDGLTNIGNRKRFDEELAKRFEQARVFNGCLGLIILDVDNFKTVNDVHGHQAGDTVLTELASRLAEVVRSADLVCRYGGEEFGVVLPGASQADLAAVAERLRRSVTERPFQSTDATGNKMSLNVSVSLGVAVFAPDTAHALGTTGQLIAAADKALYVAKKSGKNCFRFFDPDADAAAA